MDIQVYQKWHYQMAFFVLRNLPPLRAIPFGSSITEVTSTFPPTTRTTLYTQTATTLVTSSVKKFKWWIDGELQQYETMMFNGWFPCVLDVFLFDIVELSRFIVFFSSLGNIYIYTMWGRFITGKSISQ